MDAITMNFTGLVFGYSLPMAITNGVAGGICFYEGFRNHDMLFALVQGTPHDYIVGIPIREHVGVEEQQSTLTSDSFGFVRHTPNPIASTSQIDFMITQPCKVSLRIYDIMGRLIRTLFDGYVQPGKEKVYWDGKDNSQQNVASGVYLLQLDAGDRTDIRKLVLLR
jgi:hypothetical protein